jgi:hypothetical protein
MPTESEYAYYWNFPRRNLSFKVSRRGLIQTIALEYEVLTGKDQGGMEYKLWQLGSVANEKLFRLKPCIIAGTQITTRESSVWGQPPESAESKRLFSMEPATLYAFNLINGRNTLHTIARNLAQQMTWSEEQAFAFVRGLFLHLVQLRICLPKG